MNSNIKHTPIVSNIERQVMASVGTIYAARQLTSTTALKVYALILSVWGIGRLVWVSKVFTNFLQVEKNGAGSIANFVVKALEHANIGVQLALLVAIVAAASLVSDVIRSMGTQGYGRNILA